MNRSPFYGALAYIYDRLMEDAPYPQWLDFLLQKIREELPDCRRILDLGCGTGRLAVKLAELGYDVTGVDLSEEMLAVAEEWMRGAGVQVRWIHQDMRELHLLERFDCIYSFCDTLNYLLAEEEVRHTFRLVSEHLVDGGLFFFDVHTPYKIVHVFSQGPFVSEDEEVAYIWLTDVDGEHLTVEHELHFFVRAQGNLYRRFSEVHRQRAYALDRFADWLGEAGLDVIQVTADFTWDPPGPESERALFLAKKRKIS